MKLSVTYKNTYGTDRFYPADNWTSDFLEVFRPPSVKSKSLSRRQVEGLKALGFEVTAIAQEL